MIFFLLGMSLPASAARVLPDQPLSTQQTFPVITDVDTQVFTVPDDSKPVIVKIDKPAATSMHDWKIWHAAKVKAAAEKAARIKAEKAAKKAAAERKANLALAASTPAGAKQQYAFSLMASSYGWTGSDQQACLVNLWNRESGWSVTASNGSSGAYGIPQALPGSKMASAGSDWATNYKTQIKWGLSYISGSYGSPCNAWSHSESVGWY